MNTYRYVWLLPTVFCLNLAQAQAPANPMDATVTVPSDGYHSSFTGYRSLIEPTVGDWREANDTVGRIGGWKTYAKEARNPETPAEVTTPNEVKPAAPVEEPLKPDSHHGSRR